MKYIFGDIHGCFDTLMALLAKLPEGTKKEDIIFVGDLVDRGPKNRAVVDFIREGGYDCLLGNHEDLMIQAIEENAKWNSPIILSHWAENGGNVTFKEYENDTQALIRDISWMQELPTVLIYENEVDKMGRKLIVTHAPCMDFFEHYTKAEDPKIQKRFEDIFIWNRKIPQKEQTEYFNVFGHNIIDNFIFNASGGLKVPSEVITPEKTLFDNLKGYAAIDTGCFVKYDPYGNENSKGGNPYRGKLSCLEFPTMRVIQQDNIDG
jgi:serine/threonine protein phosphatase 1